MVVLRDGYLQFEIKNVSTAFDFDYEYISDPPYLADIGDTRVSMKGFGLLSNISTIYHDDHDVYFNMSGLDLGLNKFKIHMEGVSDFSLVLSKLLNDLVWLISAKVQAAIDYALHDKLVPLLNQLIDSIPTVIPIGGGDLHLDLAYSDQPSCKENGHLSLPLYFAIESEAYPFSYPSVMQEYVPEGDS